MEAIQTQSPLTADDNLRCADLPISNPAAAAYSFGRLIGLVIWYRRQEAALTAQRVAFEQYLSKLRKDAFSKLEIKDGWLAPPILRRIQNTNRLSAEVNALIERLARRRSEASNWLKSVARIIILRESKHFEQINSLIDSPLTADNDAIESLVQSIVYHSWQEELFESNMSIDNLLQYFIAPMVTSRFETPILSCIGQELSRELHLWFDVGLALQRIVCRADVANNPLTTSYRDAWAAPASTNVVVTDANDPSLKDPPVWIAKADRRLLRFFAVCIFSLGDLRPSAQEIEDLKVKLDLNPTTRSLVEISNQLPNQKNRKRVLAVVDQLHQSLVECLTRVQGETGSVYTLHWDGASLNQVKQTLFRNGTKVDISRGQELELLSELFRKKGALVDIDTIATLPAFAKKAQDEEMLKSACRTVVSRLNTKVSGLKLSIEHCSAPSWGYRITTL